MRPIRIQRKRLAGFRLPPNTVCVDRTSRYGNPWKVGVMVKVSELSIITDEKDLEVLRSNDYLIRTNEEAVILFEKYTLPLYTEADKQRLKGKNLACFCSTRETCHADSILKWANTESK